MRRIRSLRSAAFLAALVWAGPAGAVVLGSEVGVELLSPGDGLALSDMVTVGAGPEILPGDGSSVGSVLLSTELIDLDVDRIIVRLEEGVAGGATGYATGARLVFRDLYATAGVVVSGVTLSTDNVTGFDASDVLFAAHRVEVFIDDLVIGEIAGIDSGTLTLDLATMVPEPGAAALCLGALAAVGAVRRRP